jgi:hypothetical protein
MLVLLLERIREGPDMVHGVRSLTRRRWKSWNWLAGLLMRRPTYVAVATIANKTARTASPNLGQPIPVDKNSGGHIEASFPRRVRGQKRH